MVTTMEPGPTHETPVATYTSPLVDITSPHCLMFDYQAGTALTIALRGQDITRGPYTVCSTI